MTTKDLINRIANKLQREPEDVKKLLDATVMCIGRASGELNDVCVPGFGNFETRLQPESVEQDDDGTRTLVPPQVITRFKYSALLTRRVRFHPTTRRS